MTAKRTPFVGKVRRIIAADDFGITRKATRNTLLLVRKGLLHRVAVFADGYESEQERKALTQSKVVIDLHLQLPGFTLAEEQKNRKRGAFRRLVLFCFGIFRGQYWPSSVQRRWEDQIELFRERYGRYPDGLNSHQYVHFFPSFFRITQALCQKYGIPYLRLGRHTSKYSNTVARILAFLRPMNLRILSKEIKTSDYFVSLDWSESHTVTEVPNGTLEIVVHPERNVEFQVVNTGKLNQVK